jgi:hypothetical protein
VNEIPPEFPQVNVQPSPSPSPARVEAALRSVHRRRQAKAGAVLTALASVAVVGVLVPVALHGRTAQDKLQLVTPSQSASPTGSQTVTPSPSRTPLAPSYVPGQGVRLDQNAALTPAPQNAHPRLTAVQAWQRYAAQSPPLPRQQPRGTIAHLGLYFNGSENGLLVYGFQIPGCFSSTPGQLLHECTEWVMVDANTGGPHGDFTFQ